MNGRFQQAWEFTAAELWEPLAGFSAYDQFAPPDLFGDLYGTAVDYLRLRPTPRDLALARNDPEHGREFFITLIGTDFINESSIVEFLEAANGVIEDYEIPGFAELYRRLIQAVLRKFNLRYRLEPPFTLRFLLPGSFSNLYGELQKLTVTNDHLKNLLNDFEHAFDHYARTDDPGDLKTCIAKASNYAEGLASVTLGIPIQGNTMGNLCNGLTLWPHNDVKEALKKLYGFCSDYPGIRHAGTPANAWRALSTRDLTIASLLLISFSGYLSPQIDEMSVLGR